MKRSLGVLVLAVLATGCASTFTASAAVVNGAKISDGALIAQIDGQVAANPSAGDPATRAQIGRDILTGLIRQELLSAVGKEHGVVVSEAEVDASLTTLRAQFGSEEEFQERMTQAGLDEDSLRERLGLQQVQIALATELSPTPTDAELRSRYEAESSGFREVTARHVLYAIGPQQTEGVAKKKANQASAALRAGTRLFASLVAESDDTASAKNGGRLGGWVELQSLDQAFAEAAWGAKIGVPTAPVRSSFGFHIILTTGKRTKPFADVRAGLEEAIRAETGDVALSDAISEAARRATILVNPRYGDWDSEAQEVVPHLSYEPAQPAPEPSFPADVPNLGN